MITASRDERNALAVTGATGFIGRHLCDHLRGRRHTVVAIARTQDARDPSVVRHDLHDANALIPLLANCHAIVHLAGRAHVLDRAAATDHEAFDAANVRVAVAAATACIAAGVRRFVFVSSAGVLGNRSTDQPLTDDSAPRPHDAYTRSKLDAERALEALARDHQLELVIVRPALVYGPDAPGNFGRLLRLAGRVPLPVGALDARRSGIGVRNLASLLEFAACSQEAAGATFLAAEPEALSVRELCERIARHRGRRPLIVPVPVPILRIGLRLLGAAGDVERLTTPFELRATRARELRWNAPHSLNAELAFSAGVPA